MNKESLIKEMQSIAEENDCTLKRLEDTQAHIYELRNKEGILLKRYYIKTTASHRPSWHLKDTAVNKYKPELLLLSNNALYHVSKYSNDVTSYWLTTGQQLRSGNNSMIWRKIN